MKINYWESYQTTCSCVRAKGQSANKKKFAEEKNFEQYKKDSK